MMINGRIPGTITVMCCKQTKLQNEKNGGESKPLSKNKSRQSALDGKTGGCDAHGILLFSD